MDERNKLMDSIRAESADKLSEKLTSNKELYKRVLKELMLQVINLH